MSRSAAATTAGRGTGLRRSPAPPVPRRVSGPARPVRRSAIDDPAARPPRARVDARAVAGGGGAVAAVAAPRPRMLPSPRPVRLVSGGAAVASRVAGAALDVSSSRFMDRLVLSRAWIVIVAFALIGIVAMQVSMLKLNAGIGNAVETATTLERTNASLRGELSRLSSGDRIQALAGARGFVMPHPADVSYLRAGDASAASRRAARLMVAPDPAIAGPAGSATTMTPVAGQPAAPAGTTAAGAATSAPAGVAPSTVAPAAPSAATSGATPAPAPAPAPTVPPASAPVASAPGGGAPAPVAGSSSPGAGAGATATATATATAP